METWTLQDAKARFSELVTRCLDSGPQFVTRHGRPAVVVISQDEYQRLKAPTTTLTQFLLSGPRVDLNIIRQKDYGREVDL